jgi:cell division protease FtsH
MIIETKTAMGPLEFRTYRIHWRASRRYRRHAARLEAKRQVEILAEGERQRSDDLQIAGFDALRKTWADLGDYSDEDTPTVADERGAGKNSRPVSAAQVAASLIFARLFDGRPELLDEIRSSAPVIAIDVPDSGMLNEVIAVWQDTLLSPSARVMRPSERLGGRDHHDIIIVTSREVPKRNGAADREHEALSVLPLALPLIAISPSAEKHLAAPILKANPVRIQFPPIDPATIARTIRVVTGRTGREVLDEFAAARLSPADLIVAIRFDRTPDECMKEIRRLAAEKDQRRTGRNIELGDIHGMDEAIKWARSSIRDLDAWRRGEIPWSAVAHSVCLVGPPGTGKTMFAAAYSRAAGVEMIGCTLAGWQGSGEGHLGHLLRAMRKDFETARAQAPCVIFIDEIDSFADRSRIRHSHADYVVEVVNAFLAELDGLAGREGVLFCAASNDLSRCDPAILRSGRFNKIIRVGLPDLDELERMFRVRLKGELAGPLDDVCVLALGSTGADVERIVEDAKRFARHENRPIEVGDLRKAVSDDHERDPAETKLAAIHEAGHILMEVLLFGEPEYLHANITASGDRGGLTLRTQAPRFMGTRDEYNKRLQVLLAGRAAEEIIIGAVSHSVGGRGGDLDQAGRLAAAMAGALGLAGPSPLLQLAQREETAELLSFPEVRRAAHAELAEALDSCRATLLERRQALEDIAAVLLRDGRIDGAAVASIVLDRSESSCPSC